MQKRSKYYIIDVDCIAHRAQQQDKKDWMKRETTFQIFNNMIGNMNSCRDTTQKIN